MSASPAYISPEQLCIGLYVQLELSWWEHDFAFSNFKIKDEAQIRALRALNLERLRYDPARSDCVPLEPAGSPGEAAVEAPPVDPQHQARQERAQKLRHLRSRLAEVDRRFSEASQRIKTLNQTLRSRPEDAVQQAGAIVSEMVETLLGAPGVVLHVDVQLHRVWLTRLAVNAAVVRGAGHDLAKPGLVSVWDAAATVIAEAFVRQTRVDPLHSAASEQALYDALPDWLAQLSRSPVASLALTVGGRSHRISLARDAVVVALNPLLTRITQALRADVAAAPDAQVMLSDRAAAIPGLIEALTTALGTAPQVLTPLAAAQGALRHRALIQTGAEALPWVTRLPAAARAAPEAPEAPETTAPVAPPAAPVQAALPPPTHLLLGDEATALVSDRVAEAWGLRVMVREDGAVGLRADSAVQLNGAPLVADTALKAGDWLQVQDRVLRVIRVRDS